MREPLWEERATSTGFHAFTLLTSKSDSGKPIGHIVPIMKEKQTEELQSRREFFKNAGSKALPFLAFAALGSSMLTSCEKDDPDSGSGGCGKSCSGSCDSGCSNNCDGLCGGDCWAYCESKVKS